MLRLTMQNEDIRKAFGLRIKLLRKQKKWPQKELAAKFDVRPAHLNKYESGLHTPPLDKIIQLAEIFDTTIDFLLTGNRSDERSLHNMRLLERFHALENFSIDDQEAVLKLIDAMIIKHQVEGVVKSHAQ